MFNKTTTLHVSERYTFDHVSWTHGIIINNTCLHSKYTYFASNWGNNFHVLSIFFPPDLRFFSGGICIDISLI
jgi:hypothetical protein